MKKKRVPFVKDAVIKNLNNTNIGINKNIINYIGEKVQILEYTNLYNSRNNVKVKTLDGTEFWVSYLDLKELSIGIEMNIYQLEKELQVQVNLKMDEIYDFIKKIIWDINRNKYKKYDEFIEYLCDTYGITEQLIFEIYFLFDGGECH